MDPLERIPGQLTVERPLQQKSKLGNLRLQQRLLGFLLVCVGFPALSIAAASTEESQPGVAEFPPAPNGQETAIDPKAAELLMRSAYFLSELPEFSFSWFISSDEVIGGREKITYVQSGVTATRRDIGFYSKTERGSTYRNYYFDGKRFTLVSPDQKFYATVDFTRSYDDLVARVERSAAVTLPMWSMLSPNLPQKLAEGVETAAYLGTTLLAGREAHHVAFSGPGEDVQVWLSTDDSAPVPLMLITTRTDLQGWPQQRVNMMDWNLAPQLAPADFSFVPDNGDLRIAFPWKEPAQDDGSIPNSADLQEQQP